MTEPDEAAQNWHFSFGSGQEHAGRYVTIHGTFNYARNEMFRHFGAKWSFQYPDDAEFATAKDRWGWTELPLDA